MIFLKSIPINDILFLFCCQYYGSQILKVSVNYMARKFPLGENEVLDFNWGLQQEIFFVI